MNVFDLGARIGCDTSEYDKALDRSESKMSSFAGKLKSGIGTIAKVTAAGLTAAAAGVAALSKKAVEGYADFEQLTGGVETLFGAGGMEIEKYAEKVGKSVDDVRDEYDKLMRAQNDVMDNAANAYMNAGLSANEYMETVTSFSASLIASLGGDTEKAASYADRAIIDMSDNANKMGSSMESIQNAYQGFAKQNYTMLDNLKLGYGGTQEEMKRLIADTAKMTDIQEKLGITVDAESMSFGNIVNAISVMQTKLGIAGTTAEEAASTISGSIGMMKSAWSNLVTGIANDGADFDKLIDNFVNSVDIAAGNIVPRIEVALRGVGKLVEKLVPTLIERIPDLINDTLPSLANSALKVIETLGNALISNAGTLIDFVTDLLKQIGDSLTQNADTIVQSVVIVIDRLIDGISTMLPELAKAGFEIIKALGQSIIDRAPDLAYDAIYVIQDFVKSISENAPKFMSDAASLIAEFAKMITDPEAISLIVDSAIELVKGLANGIITALPVLIEAAPQIIQNLVTAITDNLPKILNCAWDLVKQLTEAIFANLPMLIDVGKQIIDSIMVGLIQAITTIVDFENQIYEKIASLIIEAYHFAVDAAEENIGKMGKALVKAIMKIAPMIMKIIKNAKTFGINFVMNIILGFKNKMNQLKSAVADLTKAIKDKFDETIKKAIDWGKNLIQKVIDGIKNKINAVKQAINDVTTAIKNKFQETINKSIDWGKNLIQKIIDGVKSKIQAIKDAIGNVTTAIKDKFDEAVRGAMDWGRNLIQNFVDKVKEKWNSIKDGFFAIINGIRDGFTEIVTRARNWGENLITNFKEKFVEKWNAIKNGFFDKVGEIRKSFTDVVDKAKTWGKDLIDKFIDGIQEKWEALKKKVTDVAQLVKDYLHFSEPDEGPLSDFHTYAPDMIDLFAEGIAKNAYKITDAVNAALTPVSGLFEAQGNNAKSTAFGDTNNIFNITVQAGTISNDYDANRAAQIMAERIATLQTQQRRAIGL